MSILLSHGQGRVTEHLLKRDDVAAIHHVVAGEGMTQNVGQLPSR